MPLSSDKHIIDEQFRQKLQNHSLQPSGNVWQRLGNQLNHNESRKKGAGRWLLLLLIFVMAGGGIWIASKSPSSESGTKASKKSESAILKNDKALVSDATESKLKDVILPSMNHKDSDKPVSDHRIPVTTPSFYPNNKVNPSSIAFSNETGSPEITTEIPLLVTLPLVFIPSNSEPGVVKKTSILKSARYLKITPDPAYYVADVAGFYFGFGQTLNSIWMLDHDAIKNKSLKYRPTFGSALMVQGGYNFNNKWGLEAAWIFHSDEGQRYKYLPSYTRTTSLEYYQKNIAFNFMHVPVMMRYKVQAWSALFRTPIFVNYGIGLQYGRMLSYSIDETKEKVSENHLFRKNEYAVVAALDYDFITRKSAFYTIGIHSSLGSNLFIKDVPEDLEFEYPHNFLIGAHGAINFSLQRAPKKAVTALPYK